jgi:hypothetical protein
LYFVSRIAALFLVFYLAGCFTSTSAYKKLYSISGILVLLTLSAFMISWVGIKSVSLGRSFASRAKHGYNYDDPDPNTSVFRKLVINNAFLAINLLGLLAASIAAVRAKNVSRTFSTSSRATFADATYPQAPFISGTLIITIAAIFTLTSNAIALDKEVLEMARRYPFLDSAQFQSVAFTIRMILKTSGLFVLLWVPLGSEHLPRSVYSLVGGSYTKSQPV